MSIAKFKGRTTAGGANTQRQSAPQFRTQYSGYQRPDDNSPTYPVYNPGSHQTALREPSPEPPQTPKLPPFVKESAVIIFCSMSWAGPNSVVNVIIPQWNLSLLNHEVGDFGTTAYPNVRTHHDFSYFYSPATGNGLIVSAAARSPDMLIEYFAGFLVIRVTRTSLTAIHLIDNDRTGYEWLDDVYDLSQWSYNSILLKDSALFRKINAERYQDFTLNLPYSTSIETEITMTLDCTDPPNSPPNFLNWRYIKDPLHLYAYDPKLVQVIRETGIKKFQKKIKLPAYDLPTANMNAIFRLCLYQISLDE